LAEVAAGRKGYGVASLPEIFGMLFIVRRGILESLCKSQELCLAV
jgi:hypothetical protein